MEKKIHSEQTTKQTKIDSHGRFRSHWLIIIYVRLSDRVYRTYRPVLNYRSSLTVSSHVYATDYTRAAQARNCLFRCSAIHVKVNSVLNGLLILIHAKLINTRSQIYDVILLCWPVYNLFSMFLLVWHFRLLSRYARPLICTRLNLPSVEIQWKILFNLCFLSFARGNVFYDLCLVPKFMSCQRFLLMRIFSSAFRIAWSSGAVCPNFCITLQTTSIAEVFFCQLIVTLIIRFCLYRRQAYWYQRGYLHIDNVHVRLI